MTQVTIEEYRVISEVGQWLLCDSATRGQATGHLALFDANTGLMKASSPYHNRWDRQQSAKLLKKIMAIHGIEVSASALNR